MKTRTVMPTNISLAEITKILWRKANYAKLVIHTILPKYE